MIVKCTECHREWRETPVSPRIEEGDLYGRCACCGAPGKTSVEQLAGRFVQEGGDDAEDKDYTHTVL